MALELPTTAKQISQKAKADVRSEIESSDPFLARSYLGAIISGICNRIFEFYDAIREAELESNPATAVRNLLPWANAYGLSQLPGAAAKGQVFSNASSGGLGTLIPNLTRFVSSSGDIYVNTADATLSAFSFVIATGKLTSVGTLATCETTGSHGLASNAIMTMINATQTEYNVVDAPITVIATNKFTYVMATDPSVDTATGSPEATFEGATLSLTSEEAGEDFNLTGDTALAYETPIAGVESPVLVTFDEIIDGTDLETIEALQARLVDILQNPTTPFNVANIRKISLGISGVTRVFVQENTPAVGQVTVFFMRDLDDDPIPSPAEIDEVEAALIEIKPAHTADADVVVDGPTEISTDFIFTAASLVPDTPSMRVAIAAELAEFFRNQPDVGVDVVEDASRSAIFNTIDPSNGQRVTSFVLTAPPAAAIAIATGEIATLGSVSFT